MPATAARSAAGGAGAGRSNATRCGATTTAGRSRGWSGSSPSVPPCHEVKHAGLASKRGRLSAVIGHLADVNGWSEEDAGLYLEAAFETWATRSRHQWTLDVSVLATRYGIDPDATPDGNPG